jgi:hypothetical protein
VLHDRLDMHEEDEGRSKGITEIICTYVKTPAMHALRI